MSSNNGGNSAGNLKKENDSLKGQVKSLEQKLSTLQTEIDQSTEGIKRLETQCADLEKENTVTTEIGEAQVLDAEKQGLDLASELAAGMEVAKDVNKSIDKIGEENTQAYAENVSLVENMKTMQAEHEKLEEEMKSMLIEQCEDLVKLRTEIGQVKLQNAQDKERLYGEMQQLASTLLSSREQLKEAKDAELKLRLMLQNYDKKFASLQTALQETNTAYDGFKGEMVKVCERTKELENETVDWKDKWAQSNSSLQAANEEHSRVQTGITRSHEGLAKMTNLCRALQEERKQLLEELNRTKTSTGEQSG